MLRHIDKSIKIKYIALGYNTFSIYNNRISSTQIISKTQIKTRAKFNRCSFIQKNNVIKSAQITQFHTKQCDINQKCNTLSVCVCACLFMCLRVCVCMCLCLLVCVCTCVWVYLNHINHHLRVLVSRGLYKALLYFTLL